MPHSPRRYDPSFAERVVSIAATTGNGRAQIAVALGVNLEDFAAWDAAEPAFATALADAETQALAWWEAQPQIAMHSNTPFRATAWAKGMAQRYGRPTHSSRRIEKEAAQPVIRARVNIPDNRRRRRER